MSKYLGLIFMVAALSSACSFHNRKPGIEPTAEEAVVQPLAEHPSEASGQLDAIPAEEEAGKLPEAEVELVDFEAYFQGIHGCIVFYVPADHKWLVYNEQLSQVASSPCSTFKIISSLAGLELGVIESTDTVRYWNGTTFWNGDWNRDISFEDAFRTSCVWYFRQIIDEIGSEAMTKFLTGLEYGNGDVSDWEGLRNTNNAFMELRGFWIESSLEVSPWQQTAVMNKIFGDESIYQEEHREILKQVMLQPDESDGFRIYGKTGMGMAGGKCVDAWFTGMFECDDSPVYFSLRLDDPDNPETSSSKGREIAINIIREAFPDK